MKVVESCVSVMIAAQLLTTAAAAGVDHSIYAGLLKKYVVDGQVDYRGFKTQEALLDRYLEVLEKVDPAGLSRDGRFAFYVNAYNAWTIKLILSAYPGVASIKDLGTFFQSPWKKKLARINGRLLSLDEIEHDILRAEFKDPRVHAAVNCASRSCPILSSEPYRAETLQEQLDNATVQFINDPSRNRLSGSTLYVSRIFKWFSEDFNNDIQGFFLKYARGDFRDRLLARKGALTIKYLDYDWSLNSVRP